MARAGKLKRMTKGSGATLGLEFKLMQVAVKMRNNMYAAIQSHVAPAEANTQPHKETTTWKL